MPKIDVLILRDGIHGLSVGPYAESLRERLPNHEIRIAQTPEDRQELAPQARAISGVSIDRELLRRAGELELFAGLASGYDHLPLEALSDAGVTVTTGSGVHAPNIAEQVLAYILGFVRSLEVARDQQKRRVWQHYQSNELYGSTVTIVGLGSIGRAITQRVSAFGVETIGVRYTPKKGGPTDEVIGFNDRAFHQALVETDHLVIASPLTETTRGLVDRQAFKSLPNHAYLVNVGRGPIVDTKALVEAVRKNWVNGAALDVTDPEPLPQKHPLWRFDNVTITPHTSGYSPKLWIRLAEIVAENIRHLDAGEAPEAFRNRIHC
ncbi:D-2-hydroxyacid dehydrogenase [Halobellus salinisoli]|uniref:D-2-hydroxyacid dehydrogenase n=1 Tax=Halobellus salinisoli TaxID=3108500 RepID=UPI003008BEDB